MTKKLSAAKSKLLKDLQSSDTDIVLKTVAAIAKKGELSMVRPMLDVCAATDSASVQSAICATLGDVKDEGLGAVLFEALRSEELAGIHKQIISVLWNANVPLEGHLELLIKVALAGGFEEQFETLTALDNFGGEFGEEEVVNALLDTRLFIKERGEATALQMQLLQKLEVMERYD